MLVSAINEWATIGVIRASLLLADGLEQMHAVPALAFFIGLFLPPGLNPAAVTPKCDGDLVQQIKDGATTIISVLTGVGIFITVIGIIIGGLMRATAFGNERRIATSNTAITGAIVGIVIVVLAVSAGQTIPTWFVKGATCTL
ncbi:hypothetical protein KSF_064260 [Reticulibacter mediterranei]|uniref:Uncharacterized protein n=1 Tax=Reticulibacter mediterranei TaxID=2778369 RepID=A0A8J3ILZ6_9CHLR|nr:hypothetical protein [Reticulibacter mediterranei]GHO96378.1 hypothetical protein KSF_064260 [Reticulibacter mediterranei]